METTSEMDPLGKTDRARSDFVRELVQRSMGSNPAPTGLAPPSKRIVQFWDDLARLPPDVKECMDSWRRLEELGFEIQVFDENAAKDFIQKSLGSRFATAFDMCYHPSMKSDYFRYSYIYVNGGFYIDADDVYLGAPIEHLFADGRLKLQPFCYDIPTAQMVSPSLFVNPGANELGWIFYFNTTPLIAGKHHPMVKRALMNCTSTLENESPKRLPEVQATTGPGNLTKSVIEVVKETGPEPLLIVRDWETLSISKWPLSYRNDHRNWRLSNQQAYQGTRPADGL